MEVAFINLFFFLLFLITFIIIFFRALIEKTRIKYPIEFAKAEEKIRGDPNLIYDR